MKELPHSPVSPRRHFLRAGLIASALFGGRSLSTCVQAALTKPEGDRGHGLKLGLTSYTFRKFTLDETLTMTRAAGAGYISLKDVHLPLKSTRKEREATHQRVIEAGLTLMGGGVIEMKNDPSEIRQVFDYARDASMPTIICSPALEALDTVESLAKEYDIRVAIHNHGPTDKKYPSPLDVLRLVKSRDSRMGLCMDVGHTVRIGEDPAPAIQACAARLYDFHIKDVTAADPKGKPVEVGRGVIDIVGVLRALLQIRYEGQVALEYEDRAEAPLPGVTESFGYIRGVLDAL